MEESEKFRNWNAMLDVKDTLNPDRIEMNKFIVENGIVGGGYTIINARALIQITGAIN